MSNTVLPVDPEKTDDAFYRYKMPAIMTKIEGNGNGIKTVFPNLQEIATKLNRPPHIINKFFGKELGAQATQIKTDDKFLVMGSHTQQRLQDTVYRFINKFVLCKACRNPETGMAYEKKKLFLKCKSCGSRTDIASTESVVGLFKLWCDTNDNKKGDYAPAEASGSPIMDESKGQPTEGGTAAAVAAVAADVPPADIKTQKTFKENPIDVLAKLLTADELPIDQLVSQTYKLKTEANVKDKEVMRLVFRGVMKTGSKTPFKTLQKRMEFLKFFTSKPEAQLLLIRELLIVCCKSKYAGGAHKVPMGLKLLWEEGALSAVEIEEWFQNYKPSKESKEVPREFFDEAKAKSAPLVEWLAESAQ